MRDLTSSTDLSKPHRLERSGWLRASILGANDGLISIASHIVGVAAALFETHTIMMTGSQYFDPSSAEVSL